MGKFFGVIYSGKLQVHPQAEQEVIFRIFCRAGEVWRIGVVNLVVLGCVLRTTTKKVINFLKEKVHPLEKILATPMAKMSVLGSGISDRHSFSWKPL